MAELIDRYEDNAKGPYFVDSECIDCDACRAAAPSNFTRNEAEGYSYVYKQPDTDEEKRECEEAMEECPVDAIGDCGGE